MAKYLPDDGLYFFMSKKLIFKMFWHIQFYSGAMCTEFARCAFVSGFQISFPNHFKVMRPMASLFLVGYVFYKNNSLQASLIQQSQVDQQVRHVDRRSNALLTERPTDQPTDQRTQPVIEVLCRIRVCQYAKGFLIR